jgi:2-hydroxychromene-2-carboxylate isomerase
MAPMLGRAPSNAPTHVRKTGSARPLRGAVAAQLEGVFERYVDEVFRHMWAEPKKLDDPDVVRAALEQAGFNAATLLARVQQPEVKDRLLKNTQASVARGTFGGPTFFVGNEIFFGKDRLRDVEEEIVREAACLS